MAIELLYDTIRVTAGDVTPIEIEITDVLGQPINSGDIAFVVPELDMQVDGTYDTEKQVWLFDIPKTNYKGRYMYELAFGGYYVNHPTPIYFE